MIRRLVLLFWRHYNDDIFRSFTLYDNVKPNDEKQEFLLIGTRQQLAKVFTAFKQLKLDMFLRLGKLETLLFGIIKNLRRALTLI